MLQEPTTALTRSGCSTLTTGRRPAARPHRLALSEGARVLSPHRHEHQPGPGRLDIVGDEELIGEFPGEAVRIVDDDDAHGPFADGGPHDVANGLLLRADLHILFDRGYVAVDEHNRFVVSPRLRDDYHNGRDYYARHGQPIALPADPAQRPAKERLEWHRGHVYIA